MGKANNAGELAARIANAERGVFDDDRDVKNKADG
jgi:hypothetical protein